MSDWIKVDPDSAEYAGVYYRLSKGGVKNFYINYRANGKLKWESIGKETDGFNKTMARDIRSERIRAMKLDKVAPQLKKVPTMDYAFKLFMERYVPMAQLKETKQLRSYYNNHVGPELGHYTLDKIDTPFLNRVRLRWAKKVSNSTTKGLLRLVSRIYNAMSPKYLDMYSGPNPVRDMPPIKANTQRQTFLTRRQSNKLMKELKKTDVRTYRMSAFGLYAGFRVSEVLHIRRGNISLERNTVSARTKDPRAEGKMAHIPMLPPLREVVEEILAEKTYKPNEKLFGEDAYFNYRAFYKAVDNLGLNDNIEWEGQENEVPARLRKVVFHTLRHSFASQLATEDNIPLEIVKDMMRHRNIATTAIYTKANNQQLQDAARIAAAGWAKVQSS